MDELSREPVCTAAEVIRTLSFVGPLPASGEQRLER